MFGLDTSKIKQSFRNVKGDLSSIRAEINVFKASANDWIMYLDTENKQLKVRVIELEAQVRLMQELIKR